MKGKDHIAHGVAGEEPSSLSSLLFSEFIHPFSTDSQGLVRHGGFSRGQDKCVSCSRPLVPSSFSLCHQCVSPAQGNTLLILTAPPLRNPPALCPLDFNSAADTNCLPSFSPNPPTSLSLEALPNEPSACGALSLLNPD